MRKLASGFKHLLYLGNSPMVTSSFALNLRPLYLTFHVDVGAIMVQSEIRTTMIGSGRFITGVSAVVGEAEEVRETAESVSDGGPKVGVGLLGL